MNQHIPGIEEGKAAEDEEGEEVEGPADWLDELLDVVEQGCRGAGVQGRMLLCSSAPLLLCCPACPQIPHQRHRQTEQGKGQRQDVGVHVAEDEAEGGDFDDGFQPFFGAAGEMVFVDDAGGAPPPPLAGFIAWGFADDGWPVEVAHVQPRPKAVGTYAVAVGNFQQYDKIARQRQGKGGEDAEKTGGAEAAWGVGRGVWGVRTFNNLQSPISNRYQVKNQPKCTNDRSCHQPRQPQIKGNGFGNQRQPRQ